METFSENKYLPGDKLVSKRREFIKNGFFFGTLTGVAGLGLVTGCKDQGQEEISPVNDLMREHGVLNRVMLIYDACKNHLANGENFPMEALRNSALIIRDYIEDYHEKLEEEFLFPQFAKANLLVGLVQVLYIQHDAGRKITEQIIQIADRKAPADANETQKLTGLIKSFNSMYRAHEAREDTVLFPALRKIISKTEYYTMATNFEKREFDKFGAGGYQSTLDKVSFLEEQLGIDELNKYTPA